MYIPSSLTKNIVSLRALAGNIVVYTWWHPDLLGAPLRCTPLAAFSPRPGQNLFIQAKLANVMLSSI